MGFKSFDLASTALPSELPCFGDYFLFRIYPPGLLPVLGPLERYMTPHFTRPCYVALGRVLIWVIRQIG